MGPFTRILLCLGTCVALCAAEGFAPADETEMMQMTPKSGQIKSEAMDASDIEHFKKATRLVDEDAAQAKCEAIGGACVGDAGCTLVDDGTCQACFDLPKEKCFKWKTNGLCGWITKHNVCEAISKHVDDFLAQIQADSNINLLDQEMLDAWAALKASTPKNWFDNIQKLRSLQVWKTMNGENGMMNYGGEKGLVQDMVGVAEQRWLGRIWSAAQASGAPEPSPAPGPVTPAQAAPPVAETCNAGTPWGFGTWSEKEQRYYCEAAGCHYIKGVLNHCQEIPDYAVGATSAVFGCPIDAGGCDTYVCGDGFKRIFSDAICQATECKKSNTCQEASATCTTSREYVSSKAKDSCKTSHTKRQAASEVPQQPCEWGTDEECECEAVLCKDDVCLAADVCKQAAVSLGLTFGGVIDNQCSPGGCNQAVQAEIGYFTSWYNACGYAQGLVNPGDASVEINVVYYNENRMGQRGTNYKEMCVKDYEWNGDNPMVQVKLHAPEQASRRATHGKSAVLGL